MAAGRVPAHVAHPVSIGGRLGRRRASGHPSGAAPSFESRNAPSSFVGMPTTTASSWKRWVIARETAVRPPNAAEEYGRRDDVVADRVRIVQHGTDEEWYWLRAIATALDDSWSTFWPTLLATIAGAVVALTGAWLLDVARRRHESELLDQRTRAEYDARIDGLLFEVLNEIGARRERLVADPAVVREPASVLHAKVSNVRFIARGSDAAVAKQMQLALTRISTVMDSVQQERETRIVGQIIRAWREESHSAEKAIERLMGLARTDAAGSV